MMSWTQAFSAEFGLPMIPASLSFLKEIYDPQQINDVTCWNQMK
jgi:hypothetical protein